MTDCFANTIIIQCTTRGGFIFFLCEGETIGQLGTCMFHSNVYASRPARAVHNGNYFAKVSVVGSVIAVMAPFCQIGNVEKEWLRRR